MSAKQESFIRERNYEMLASGSVKIFNRVARKGLTQKVNFEERGKSSVVSKEKKIKQGEGREARAHLSH